MPNFLLVYTYRNIAGHIQAHTQTRTRAESLNRQISYICNKLFCILRASFPVSQSVQCYFNVQQFRGAQYFGVIGISFHSISILSLIPPFWLCVCANGLRWWLNACDCMFKCSSNAFLFLPTDRARLSCFVRLYLYTNNTFTTHQLWKFIIHFIFRGHQCILSIYLCLDIRTHTAASTPVPSMFENYYRWRVCIGIIIYRSFMKCIRTHRHIVFVNNDCFFFSTAVAVDRNESSSLFFSFHSFSSSLTHSISISTPSGNIFVYAQVHEC